MKNIDYLDQFTTAVREYGDLLQLETPTESGEGYVATLRDHDDSTVLRVSTQSLAVTLYCFVDALLVLEDHGEAPTDPDAADEG